MTTKTKSKLTEEEIDREVVARAGDDSAWEKPVQVKRDKPASLSIPPELAERAAFLAHLHRKANLQEWLTDVIEERIEFEEVAFARVKHELASGPATGGS